MTTTANVAGRVLQSGISSFRSAAPELDLAPPLGTLVVVLDHARAIYGIVSDIRTEGRDPGRQPSPRGGRDDDRAAVLAQNPQIPMLLQTTFDARVAGFIEQDGEPRRYLPDAPAQIYARVREADHAEIGRFFEQFDFLPLLLSAGPLGDEVVAAAIRRAAMQRAAARPFLVRAGRALAAELSTDSDRLTTILARIRP